MEILNHLKKNLGLAGVVLSALIAFVAISTILYFFTGIGGAPEVSLRAVTRENDVVLIVDNGEISSADWKFKVYSVVSNPPSQGKMTMEDIEPGKEIVLKSGLSQGRYAVKIWHEPSNQFIYETEVHIGG